MKKSFIAMLVLLAWSASAAFATDCRILGKWKVEGSDRGPNADYEMLVSMDGLGPGIAFFEGQRREGKEWIPWPIVDNNDGTATVKIYDWVSGEKMEYSYGRGSVWTDPMCSDHRFPLNVAPEDTHFRDQFGEKHIQKSNPAQAAINSFLLKGEHNPPVPPIIHSCVVVETERIDTDGGALGDYRITPSLQKFTDAPAGAVPYVARQSAPNSAWTGYYAVHRNGDTAVFTVTNWPVGAFIDFSYKLVWDGTDYWQNLLEWTGSCASTYIHDGHIRVFLN